MQHPKYVLEVGCLIFWSKAWLYMHVHHTRHIVQSSWGICWVCLHWTGDCGVLEEDEVRHVRDGRGDVKLEQLCYGILSRTETARPCTVRDAVRAVPAAGLVLDSCWPRWPHSGFARGFAPRLYSRALVDLASHQASPY